MSIKVRAEVKGGEDLLRKLKEINADIKAALEEAAKEGGEVILSAAKDMAPGPNLVMEITERKKTHATVSIGPDKEHWYYRFFESGVTAHEVRPKNSHALQLDESTWAMFANPSGFPARPFLRPAFDDREKEATNAAGDKLREAVERTTR